jgi:hypothetical protein
VPHAVRQSPQRILKARSVRVALDQRGDLNRRVAVEPGTLEAEATSGAQLDFAPAKEM